MAEKISLGDLLHPYANISLRINSPAALQKETTKDINKLNITVLKRPILTDSTDHSQNFDAKFVQRTF